MGKRKQTCQMKKAFGTVPNQHYFSEDMENIRIYHVHRRKTEPEIFMLDETPEAGRNELPVFSAFSYTG